MIAAISLASMASGYAASGPSSSAPAQPGRGVAAKPAADYGKIPLSFEPNQGQSDPRVQFLSRGRGYSLFLTPGEMVLDLQKQDTGASHTLRMKLSGADSKAAVAGLDRQPGIVNYFRGNDPRKWHVGIPTFSKVESTGVYPGIDLVFYGNQRQLEYDFVVAPGADPSRIAWQIDAGRGAAGPTVDADGNLQLEANNVPASFKKPVVYQLDGDRKLSVEARYQTNGNLVRFALGSYDHTKTLIIDPTLVYATYLGGAAEESSPTGGFTQIGSFTGFSPSGVSNPTQALAIDSAGDVYVTGYTNATDFPIDNPYQGTAAGIVADFRATAAFVTKFNPQGTGVIYSTYLGGATDDSTFGTSIAVDADGDAYVAGYTNEATFPVTAGAYQTICGANWNGSTRINGCGFEAETSGFVTKLDPTGGTLVYSTFLSGQIGDQIYAIAVDANGLAYVAGNSSDYCNLQDDPAYACFPTTAGAVLPGTASAVFQSAQGNGLYTQMAFMTVFDAAGANLLYSTYIGDNTALIASGAVAQGTFGGTNASAVTVDSAGDFFLAGITRAPNLPVTLNAFQGAPSWLPASGIQGYVAKFSPITATGSTLDYLTYFGGPDAGTGSAPSGIAADSEGEAYITGKNFDQNFPTTPNAFQTSCGITGDIDCDNAFVSKLNASGTGLVWSTMLGQKFNGAGQPVFDVGPIQLDSAGNVYIAGQTTGANNDFPLVNPIQTGSDSQTFISEFNPAGTQLLFSTLLGSGTTGGTETPAGLAVDASGNIYLAGNTNSAAVPTTHGAFQTSFAGQSEGYIAKISPLLLSTTTLGVSPNPASVGQTVTLTATVTGSIASPTPTGIVTFFSGGNELGTGTVNSAGIATSPATFSAANMYSLTAVYGGDGSFASSTSTAQSLNVNSGTQTITFGSLPNVTYGVGSISLGATASSGLPVSYSVTGPASLNGSTLKVTGVGTIQVTASQAGNSNYSQAASVIQSFMIAPAALTVTAANASIAFGHPIPAFTYSESGFVNGDTAAVLSGAPVETTTATSTSAPGQYTITIVRGTLTTANYSFTLVNGTLTIGKATQSITFGALPSVNLGVAPIALAARASSGLSISYSVTGPASVSGSTLTVTGAGTVAVTASQSGNADYSAAASVTQSFTVSSSSAANFTIVADPASETIARGVLAAFLLQIKSVDGFKGNVKLSCSGGPVGSECADLPQTVPVNGTAYALSGILLPKNAAPGTYTITFTGASGLLTNTATAKFIVK